AQTEPAGEGLRSVQSGPCARCSTTVGWRGRPGCGRFTSPQPSPARVSSTIGATKGATMPPIDLAARVHVLLQAATEAIRRFPVAVGGCLMASMVILLLVHDIRLAVGDAPLGWWLVWIGVGLALGGFVAALLAEARSWPRAAGIGAALLAGTVVAAHLIWVESPWTNGMLMAGLALGLFGLPSLAAGQEDDAAWAYAVRMIGRLGFAFGAALVADQGIGLLLMLVRTLLGIEISLRLSLDITIMAFGVLAPLLLFGRVDRPAAFGAAPQPPQWLRLFMAWICVPLAFAYLVVYALYLARIAIAWDLPDGRIAWSTIGIAALGLLAHLLAYPYREQGPSWVRFYYWMFFPALVPALVAFALSLWARIDAYGMTEARYLLCLLLLWLGTIAALALLGRYRPVLVPAVLALL